MHVRDRKILEETFKDIFSGLMPTKFALLVLSVSVLACVDDIFTSMCWWQAGLGWAEVGWGLT